MYTSVLASYLLRQTHMCINVCWYPFLMRVFGLGSGSDDDSIEDEDDVRNGWIDGFSKGATWMIFFFGAQAFPDTLLLAFWVKLE